MRKAQQLVEFALVVPIILVILLVIIELGFAINARITLAEAVKMSINKVNQLYDASDNAVTKQTQIQNSLTNSMQSYFSTHNMPYSNTMTVKLLPGINGSQTSLVVASYTYYPVFTLLNVFGATIIPTSIPMTSFQTVNNALLNGNNYPSTLLGVNNSSTTSNNALAVFINDTTSSLPQTSILKGDTDNGGTIDGISIPNVKKMLAFLVNFTPTGSLTGSSDVFVRLFNWWGEDLLPVNEVFDITTGHVEVKSPYYNSGNWFDTQIPYNWVLTSLGFTQAIYTQYDTSPPFPTIKLNLASSNTNLNLNLPWCDDPTSNYGICSDDMSTTTNNLNKRGLSFIFSTTGGASGTYDPSLISSGRGNSDYLVIHNHSYMNTTYNYFLKLFYPGLVSPVDTYNGFKSQFSINADGTVNTSGSANDITDIYIDSDGDGIPDAWDAKAGYFDADAEGNFDGAINLGLSIPYNQTNIPVTFTNYSGALPDSSSTNPALWTFSCGSANVFLATPYDLNGNLNDVNGHTYAPALFSSAFNYVTTEHYNGQPYTGLYFCNGTTIQRTMTTLKSTDKYHFTNTSSTSPPLALNPSVELTALTSGAFANKVGH